MLHSLKKETGHERPKAKTQIKIIIIKNKL